MPNELRHKTVAVAVIYSNEQGFLLWNNKRWGGYAFPMKHMEVGDKPAQAALSALDDRDFPLSLPGASASPLECTGAFGPSDAVREDTYYDYDVFEIDPGEPLDPAVLDPDLRFFTYEQLQAATNVTWSTRAIATSLVEFQEVVAAVICRDGPAGKESLLVHNWNYQYFFPVIRRKTDSPLEELAIQAVRFDTAYEGNIAAEFHREVSDLHASTRFGPRQRQYRFYLCKVALPGVDLRALGNALEKAIDSLGTAKQRAGQQFGQRGYWAWFTTAEMRTRPDMSPDMPAVLSSAIEVAKQG